jgi:hypothetical protein
MNYHCQNKWIIGRIERINITDYLRIFLLKLATKEKGSCNLSEKFQAERIKGLLNIANNTAFKSIGEIETGIPYWNEQRVDYVPSNLGRGFLFYFICNQCGRRVKYLFEYSSIKEPVCRRCCRLSYKKIHPR